MPSLFVDENSQNIDLPETSQHSGKSHLPKSPAGISVINSSGLQERSHSAHVSRPPPSAHGFPRTPAVLSRNERFPTALEMATEEVLELSLRDQALQLDKHTQSLERHSLSIQSMEAALEIFQQKWIAVHEQAHRHEAEMDALRSRLSTLEATLEAVSTRIDDHNHEALLIQPNRAAEASVHVQIQRLDEKVAKLSQDLTNLESNQQERKLRHVQFESFPGGEEIIPYELPGEEATMTPTLTNASCATAKDVQSHRRLQDSLWDAVFLIGMLEATTIRGQVLLVCGLAVNVLLQLSIVYMVSVHMIVNPYDEPVLDELRRWKECENTAEQQVAPNSGCKEIHVDVQTIWTDVNDFTTSDWPYPAGWVMSIITTAMWVLVMAVEFRDILGTINSIWCIPKGVSTCITANKKGYTLTEVHRRRKRTMLAIAIVRFGIAANLLHCGMMFLTYTSDIKELTMNAVALAFVIDLDEILFHLFAPTSVIRLIDNLEPLPIADAVGQDIDVWILVILTFTYVTVIDFVYLRRFVHSMFDVIEIIDW